MRPPILRVSHDEMKVDLFAGGGGASEGIEGALNCPVDAAINHSPEAIAVHKANHPETRHFISDVWEIDPHRVARGRRIGLLWLSPDCTHFSKAKGGKPRSTKTRSLAWVAIRWARAVKPRVIILENVEEFLTWGPVDNEGKPIEAMAGRTFKVWLGKLRACGYHVEFRTIIAADHDAHTTRERLFLIARCDGLPIVWPESTRGEGRSSAWRPAHEIINWSIPCRSIFGREKPLVEATMRRVADGVRRYIYGSGEPFVVRTTEGLIAPLITKGYGGPNGHGNAGLDVRRPLGTVTAQDHHWLVQAMLARPNGAAKRRSESVRAFLVKYYGAGGQHQSLLNPLHTVTAVARFGLVTVHGEPYEIQDIGMRMLTPRELFAAQGFRDSYIIDLEFDGRPLSIAAQTRLAGNSVCPPVARQIVAANVGGAASRAA